MPKIRQSFRSKETLLEIRHRGEVGREIARSLTTDPQIVAGNMTVRTRTAKGTDLWRDVCLGTLKLLKQKEPHIQWTYLGKCWFWSAIFKNKMRNPKHRSKVLSPIARDQSPEAQTNLAERDDRSSFLFARRKISVLIFSSTDRQKKSPPLILDL